MGDEENFYKVSSEKMFPKSRKRDEAEKKAKNAYLKEAPIISGVICRLEKQIELHSSIFGTSVEDDPEKFMRQVAVNKRLVSILGKEVSYLKNLVKKYGGK